MSFSFDYSSKKNSYTDTQSIAPQDYNRQVANYTQAQGLPQTYTPTSATQIQSYMDPYIGSVVKPSLEALNQSRLMALNTNKENAIGGGAFSSYDGRAIADSLTNTDFARQAGLLSSQLYSQGYGQALGAAQGENQYGYAYPVARQGLLNQTLDAITPTVTRSGSGKQSGWDFGFKSGEMPGSGSGSGGGGSADYAKMFAQYVLG